MMKSCKILNVARLLALALVAVLLIPACLPVAHAATATKLALLMEAEKYQYIEGDMFDPEALCFVSPMMTAPPRTSRKASPLTNVP